MSKMRDGSRAMQIGLMNGWPICAIFSRIDEESYTTSYFVYAEDLELGISALVPITALNPTEFVRAREKIYERFVSLLKIRRESEKEPEPETKEGE